MQSTLANHHVNLSAAERLHVAELDGRMQRYFRDLMVLSWEIHDSTRQYVVRCSVHARSGFYRAQGTAGSVGAALDLAYDKIVRQRRRARSQGIKARHRDGTSAKVTARMHAASLT